MKGNEKSARGVPIADFAGLGKREVQPARGEVSVDVEHEEDHGRVWL